MTSKKLMGLALLIFLTFSGYAFGYGGNGGSGNGGGIDSQAPSKKVQIHKLPFGVGAGPGWMFSSPLTEDASNIEEFCERINRKMNAPLIENLLTELWSGYLVGELSASDVSRESDQLKELGIFSSADVDALREKVVAAKTLKLHPFERMLMNELRQGPTKRGIYGLDGPRQIKKWWWWLFITKYRGLPISKPKTTKVSLPQKPTPKPTQKAKAESTKVSVKASQTSRNKKLKKKLEAWDAIFEKAMEPSPSDQFGKAAKELHEKHPVELFLHCVFDVSENK